MPFPGSRLKNERYELLAPLRRGGAGVVWRGLDRREGVEVALKALPLDGGGREAMEREAEAALRVKHPAVLAPRDTFVDDGHAWLVLELCAGSLADVLEEHGVLPAADALAALEAPLQALAVAHAAGVVHRDLKPSNLLVRADGSVLLADFGIARMLADDRALTRSSALLGSLPYMAPEQRRDPRDVTPATDVYAAAATLVTLLLGKPAGDLYAAGLAARLEAAGVPAVLVTAILRAGAYLPEQRPADAGALLHDLGAGGSAPRNAPRPALADRVPSGRDWRTGEGGLSATRGSGSRGDTTTLRDVPRAEPSRATGLALAGTTGLAALLVGGGVGVWGGLQDAVRGRVVEEPALVTGARAFADVPVCPTPESWARGAAPQREVHPDGLREAIVFPLVTDLDGDGRPDVAYAHNASEAVRVFWGDGTGMPDAEHPQDVPAQRGNTRVVRADLDGNGLPDIVWSWVNGIAWLPQTAPRQFGAVRLLEEVERVAELAAGDVDRDGHDDLVLRLGDDLLFLRRGDGQGNLGTLVQMGIVATRVALGDVLGDAGVDLVTVEDGRLRLREGLPDGRWSTALDLGAVPLPVVHAVFTHRAGDATWIAVSGALEPEAHPADTARVLRFTPSADGTWSACALAASFRGGGAVAEVNGDGAPDVLGAGTCGYCTSEYFAWVSR